MIIISKNDNRSNEFALTTLMVTLLEWDAIMHITTPLKVSFDLSMVIRHAVAERFFAKLYFSLNLL